MVDLYYYDNNGKKQGPVTGKQLRQLALQGDVSLETKVETSDGRFVIAKDVKGLTFLETKETSEEVLPKSTQPELAEQQSTQESPATEPNPPTSPASADGENLSMPESTDESIQDIPTTPPDTSEPSDISEISVSETTRDVAERILSELQPILTTLNEKVESLTKETEFFNQLVAKKEEQIDKLYNENQDYKQGIHEKLKKSLVLAVIGQIDAAIKTISHFGNQEFSEENYCKLLENYREIATDFQDSLAQSFDVVAFSSEENTHFDAKRQRALKTVPTEEEAKHKTISQSLRQGYEMANEDGTKTLLRLEMVEVYVHQSLQS